MDFRKEHPVGLIRDFNPDAGEFAYRANVEAQPPLRVSALVGDIVYNLHAALDHLAWQLAALETRPKPPIGNVTFPIFKNRSRFWRKDKRTGEYIPQSGARRLRAMPDEARELVLEVQPYQAGNEAPDHPLWLLHELSNEDKHKAVHVVVSALYDNRLAITKGDDILRIKEFKINAGPVEDGAVLGLIRASVIGEGEIEMNPEFGFNEAFAQGGPAAGRRVSTTLHEIMTYVIDEVFVARFQPFFERL